MRETIKRIARNIVLRLYILALQFQNDTRAMVFDMMRIIFMVISIVVGNLAGALIGGYIGFAGGLIGAIIVGVVIYYLYSLLTGQTPNLMGSIIFGVLNYVSTIITGYVGTYTGFQAGIAVTIIQACVLSMLWGWFGAKAQSGVKTGLST